ncbi:MAG: ATP-binding protein, partial [Cytophagaceae bacterium]
MKTIRLKIIILYVVASVCLLSLGGYSWYSSQQMSQKVREFIRINPKSKLYNQITTNLYKLNNLYLTYSATNNLDTIQSYNIMINAIKHDIIALQNEYDSTTEILTIKSLGEIPDLLDSIQTEYFQVQKKKKESQKKFVNKLENELKKVISQYQGEDPVYIIKNIKSQILLKENLDSVYYRKKEPETSSKGLLGNIFKKKEPEPDHQPDSLIISKKVEKDTINGISFDTLAHKPREDMYASVEKVLNRLYREEIANVNNLLLFEKNIFSKNTLITYNIENRIHQFRTQEAEIQQEQRKELYAHSQKFNQTIFVIIIIFIIISFLFLYFISRDIKRNHYYQEQLLRNEEKAIREAKAKQKFLATMSHELRTPLTSIIGYADLLEGDKEVARAIKSSSSNLLHVANEILDMSKIIAGNIDMKPSPVNIKKLFDDIRLNFEVLNIKEDIKSIFEFPQIDIVVNTDGVRLYQVVYNLLHNAQKFTQKGYIKLSVQASEQNEGKVALQIKVEDTGIGIKKEDQSRIFEDYNQAGTHKDNLKGSGLGLGIVKELVSRLGGNISLESEPGKGSCFTIDFLMDTAVEEVNAEHNYNFNENAFTGFKIFSVDDDPLITKLYKRILEAHGAKVTLMNDSSAALNHLKENHYDLVITDIKMPGMTGYELLDKLIEADKKPKKIVASTANILLSKREREQLKKFDSLISKPVTKKDLLQNIAKVLNIEKEDISIAPVAVEKE